MISFTTRSSLLAMARDDPTRPISSRSPDHDGATAITPEVAA
ncbi:hypothetical protein [Halovivax asiaticus]|nr:hypothetical protein [Halovivax asiaticus]